MKKIVKLNLILIIVLGVMCITGKVYALSSNVSLETTKTEVTEDEEFVVDVKLSNIQSNRGILSFQGTLEYDKESLTLVKMQGKNDWNTPVEGISYNPENNTFVMAKNGLAKTDEEIISITFKVKKDSKENIKIQLKDITVGDGDEPANVNSTYIDITVKSNAQSSGSEIDNTNNNNNSSNNNNQADGTISSGTLPKTGQWNGMLLICTGMAIVGSITFYIKMRN